MASSGLVSRNVKATNGRTSIRLEPELWDALFSLLEQRKTTFAKFVRDLEKQGLTARGGRTSAVRVAIVMQLRANAPLHEDRQIRANAPLHEDRQTENGAA